MEKLIGKDGPRFWFKNKKPEPPEKQPEIRLEDQSVTEDAADDSTTIEDIKVMSEVDTGEEETVMKMWLSAKVTTLEKENEDLKRVLQEMEAKIELQEKTIAEMAQRHGAIETTITQIWEHVRRQDTFNEGVRASFTSLAEEVGKHQNNFRDVVRIIQTHEERIVKTGAASQEMAQRINALIKENENKTVWIRSLMRESQEQTQVLRQHQLGLQVQAEVIKAVANQQQCQHPPQTQSAERTSPTVVEVNDKDGDRLDFLGGQSPNTGPPNTGQSGVNQIQQLSTGTVVVPRQF